MHLANHSFIHPPNQTFIHPITQLITIIPPTTPSNHHRRLDTCIGRHNHLAFFKCLLISIVTLSYGIHLTWTTLCTPEIYLDWFLIPADCRFIYNDFPYVFTFFLCSFYVDYSFSIFNFLTFISICFFSSFLKVLFYKNINYS